MPDTKFRPKIKQDSLRENHKSHLNIIFIKLVTQLKKKLLKIQTFYLRFLGLKPLKT